MNVQSRLRFFKETHQYQIDGVLVPSVTQILETICSAHGLVGWASKAVAARALERPNSPEAWHLAPVDLRDQAGAFGHAVHKACEDFLHGRKSGFVDDNVSECVKYLAHALDDLGAKVIDSEFQCFDPQELYAGTVDLAIQVPSLYGDRVIVADIKTSRSMFLAPTSHYCKTAAQIAAYANASDVDVSYAVSGVWHDVDKDVGLVLCIRPDGYKVVELGLKEGYEEFLRAKASRLYRRRPARHGVQLSHFSKSQEG